MEESKSKRNRKKINYSKSCQSSISDDDFISDEPITKKNKKTTIKDKKRKVCTKAQRLIDLENEKSEDDLNRAILLSISSANADVSNKDSDNNILERNCSFKGQTRFDSPKDNVEDGDTECKKEKKLKTDRDNVTKEDGSSGDEIFDPDSPSDCDSVFSMDESKILPKNKNVKLKSQKSKNNKVVRKTETSPQIIPNQTANATLKTISKSKSFKHHGYPISSKELPKSLSKIKQPVWTAPGKIGTRIAKPSINSQHRFRIGLSRNYHLKPLHSNVKQKL